MELSKQQKQQHWKNLKRAVLEEMIVIPSPIPQSDPLMEELRKHRGDRYDSPR